jgi:anti-sigma factor RsiW
MLPDRISRLLTAYVDGELTAQQRQAVHRLLHRSSEARELWRDLQKDADQLRSLPGQTLVPDFSQHVLQTIASRKVGQDSNPVGKETGLESCATRRSALSLPPYVPLGLSLAAAAAVLLLAGLGSYVYFATVDRQHRAELALRSLQSTRSPIQQSQVEPEVNPSPARKPELYERLGPPVAESKASSFAVIPSNKDDKPSADPKETVLASPVRQESAPLKAPDMAVALFNLQDLDQANWKQQLQQQLQKGAAHRMELRCTDTLTGVQRLQRALASRGFQFIIDQDAQALLKLGMRRDTRLALYLEEVTADDLVTALQQLSSEDRKAEVKRRGSGQFDSLIVNAMTREDQQKLPWILGIAAAQLDAPVPKAQARVDLRKRLPATTQEQAAQLLRGQGTPQPESGKPVIGSPDRQALVVAYTPGRPRPTSVELKRFFASRQERRAGTLQILLVLTPAK